MRLDRIAGRGGTDNVRYGSLADITSRPRRVRYSPQSGHSSVRLARPLSANSGHHSGDGVGALRARS